MITMRVEVLITLIIMINKGIQIILKINLQIVIIIIQIIKEDKTHMESTKIIKIITKTKLINMILVIITEINLVISITKIRIEI